MNYSDEVLMAYVDGELDAPTRAAIDTALEDGADAELMQRVHEQRALREQISLAFDPVLDEPMPLRLLAATRAAAGTAPPSNVVDLHAGRGRQRWRWPEWGAMAASLAIGVVAGALLLRDSGLPTSPVVADAGRLVAAGDLAAALNTRVAAEVRGGDAVLLGVSFVAGSGEYCRSFALRHDGAAGLACRRGDAWQVDLLAHGAPATAPARYREAGVALPAAVLRAIDERIEGQALDAQAERAAVARGWQR